MTELKKFSSWDFAKRRVQNDSKPGKYIGSKSTLIAFGPPEWETLIDFDDLTICGEIQNFSATHQKEIIRLYEIGSSRSQQVTGKAFGSMQINRILFNGASLLRYMYKYFLMADGSVDYEQLKLTYDEEFDSNGDPMAGLTKSSLMVNIASMLADLPFGIMIYHRDTMGRPSGAVYYENCLISDRQFSMSEGNPVLMETMSIQFERPQEVSLEALKTEDYFNQLDSAT